jgi:hypothetical protein
MKRIGTCASCRGDVMLVYFDANNGCRFCIECGRRGPEATLVTEMPAEEPTVVDFLSPEEVTRIRTPPPELIESMRKGMS